MHARTHIKEVQSTDHAISAWCILDNANAGGNVTFITNFITRDLLNEKILHYNFEKFEIRI